ncbi:hypothetical protein K435DRAFT_800656 [Dendrothele bispora CBS 962.96]|uniref:Uncharacterized protein n=1 Tax=Dendrothele bispora (strain CBS 962.96) TaxID=1314807 RepID=A0A4S8LT60_DENBC|nr:hypothetical protein K435DRAFT_800656 [Dendrothele bispora CBS 962.96]
MIEHVYEFSDSHKRLLPKVATGSGYKYLGYDRIVKLYTLSHFQKKPKEREALVDISRGHERLGEGLVRAVKAITTHEPNPVLLYATVLHINYARLTCASSTQGYRGLGARVLDPITLLLSRQPSLSTLSLVPSAIYGTRLIGGTGGSGNVGNDQGDDLYTGCILSKIFFYALVGDDLYTGCIRSPVRPKPA